MSKSGPNKTVAKFRRANPRASEAPASPMRSTIEEIVEQMRAGRLTPAQAGELLAQRAKEETRS